MVHSYQRERTEYGSEPTSTGTRLHRPMTPIALFAVALAGRVLVGGLFGEPAYPDSYYYVNVARELAAGNGLQVGYIWNFVDVGGRLPSDPQLPIPANAHWMPLAVLVQVPFIWLLGPVPLASALPFWLIGATAAPLAYAIGIDAGLERRVALTAGLLTAIPAGLLPFMAQPDNFGLYMTLGALALWLSARTWRGDRRALVLGGFVVGLATLARNDGLLLAIPLAAAAAVAFRRSSARRPQALAAAASAALFVLTLGPWLARQLVVFGSLSPSAASGRILWLSDYDQLWSIGELPTPDSLLAGGLAPLLASRLDGLAWAVGIFALLPLAGVLLPLALWGAWQRRRDAAFTPFFVYAALLFGANALLFAVHVPHGTFLHSVVALLPHTFLLVALGIGRAVEWAAARRPNWSAPAATRVFSAGAVALALAVAAQQTAVTVAGWRASQQPRVELAGAIAALPPGEPLMAADPGAYNYRFGRPGIVTPNDPLSVVEAAARAYGVRWLVLERAAIVPALQPVLRGEERPRWLSEPLAVASVGADGIPTAALYAVCTMPADDRCTR
jgi:4-amino-4-deoxy-L-arabinose transferase-like glycosyltransferase